MLDNIVDRLSLQQLEYQMERVDIPDDCSFFRNMILWSPCFPLRTYSTMQATKLILSRFQEEYHLFNYNTLRNNKAQLFCLYLVYRP